MEENKENTVTVEEFEEHYVPLLNAAADLLLTHQEIPEDMDMGETLASIHFLSEQLEESLKNRVPQINALEDKIEKQKAQIRKLQETNQALFLKLGSRQPPEPAPPQEKPKKSFHEIKNIIDTL